MQSIQRRLTKLALVRSCGGFHFQWLKQKSILARALQRVKEARPKVVSQCENESIQTSVNTLRRFNGAMVKIPYGSQKESRTNHRKLLMSHRTPILTGLSHDWPWCNPQRPVYPAEMIVHKVERNHESMIRNFLAKALVSRVKPF